MIADNEMVEGHKRN